MCKCSLDGYIHRAEVLAYLCASSIISIWPEPSQQFPILHSTYFQTPIKAIAETVRIEAQEQLSMESELKLMISLISCHWKWTGVNWSWMEETGKYVHFNYAIEPKTTTQESLRDSIIPLLSRATTLIVAAPWWQWRQLWLFDIPKYIKQRAPNCLSPWSYFWWKATHEGLNLSVGQGGSNW
jgi:hypothetical protein